VYDLAGRTIASENPLGFRTTTVYDAAGQTRASVNALGYRTSSTFDLAGRQTRLSDANANSTTFLYDAAGQDVGRIDPLLRRTTHAYDLAGRRTLKLDARGLRVTSVYDAAGQQTGERLPAGARTTFAYDAASRRTLLADGTGRTSTVYDAAGQVQAVAQPAGKRVSYSYDAAGRRRQLRDPDGGRTTYAFDAAGQLTGLVSPQNGRTTFAYDPAGRTTVKRPANGTRVTHQYDAAGQLTGIRSTTVLGGLPRRLTYTYDPAARRSTVRTADGTRTTWTYDAAGQLATEWTVGAQQYAATHRYDPAGNRTAQLGHPSYIEPAWDTTTLTYGGPGLVWGSAVTTTYTYDAANQLTVERTSTARTTYQYDAAGNRSRKDAPAATTYYTWDARNRLTEAEPVSGPVTYTYDGTDRRATKQADGDTTRYVWDFEKVLQEADGTLGTTENQYLSTDAQYGDLVSSYGGGQSRYYEFDALGSADALLDDAGSATSRFSYQAFGLTTQTAGTETTPFTWVGQQGYQRETETDLYFLRARYYDPATARFLSKDPIEYAGGDTNLYRYTANDPVNRTDPSGNRLYVQDLYGRCKKAGSEYSNEFKSAEGDILRDELWNVYHAWENKDDVRLYARNDPTIRGDTKKRLELTQLPAEFWSAVTKDYTGGNRSLHAQTITDALKEDWWIEKQFDGIRETGHLNWHRYSAENSSNPFVGLNRYLDAVGASLAGQTLSTINAGVAQAEAVAQVGLVYLAKQANVDLDKLLQALKEIPDILDTIVADPSKVMDNLVEGVRDGFKTFFDPNHVVGNIQHGFKDWLSKSYTDLGRLEKFPADFTVAGFTDFALDYAGLSLSSIKDIIYTSVTKALNSKGKVAPATAANLIGLVYEDLGLADAQDKESDNPDSSLTRKILNAVGNFASGEFGPALDLLDEFKSFISDFIVNVALQLGAKVAEWLTGIPFKTIYDSIIAFVNGFQLVSEFFVMFVKSVKEIVGASSVGIATAAVIRLLRSSIPVALKALLVGIRAVTGINIDNLLSRISCILGRIRTKLIEWLSAEVTKLIDKLFGTNRRAKKAQCQIKGRCTTGGQSKDTCSVQMATGCRNLTASGGTQTKRGQCFAFGTLVWSGRGQGCSIEEFRIGRRVLCLLSSERDEETSRFELNETYDSLTHRTVRLIQIWEDGTRVDVRLLRSLEWLAEQNACRIGDKVILDLPELGAEGEFHVTAIDECPEIEQALGRIVTGEFRFSHGDVYNLWVDGESGPIGVTAGHPFWSVDREDWIPAERLLECERLATRDGGTTTVLRWEYRGEEAVFNLEVDADHCYRVGEQGILVHNASVLDGSGGPPGGFFTPSDATRTADYVKPGALIRGSSPRESRLFRGGRNLGVLYYITSDTPNVRVRIPITGLVEGGGGPTTHSERLLLGMLPKPDKGQCVIVVEVYTERWPCKRCDSALEKYAMMMNGDQDIPVYFIAPAGSGDDDTSADQLRFAYEKVFMIRWW
jgi:RHS repeat-associated protein